MFIFWKNKGLLVLLYLIVSFVGINMLIGILRRNFGGPFFSISFYESMGIVFYTAALWTFFTRNDYYQDREGNKKQMVTVNEFFFIRMEIWAYIFNFISLLLLCNSFFHYLKPLDTMGH